MHKQGKKSFAHLFYSQLELWFRENGLSTLLGDIRLPLRDGQPLLEVVLLAQPHALLLRVALADARHALVAHACR